MTNDKEMNGSNINMGSGKGNLRTRLKHKENRVNNKFNNMFLKRMLR